MKARAPWMAVLFLVLLAPLIWPPSTIAQQFPQRPATVKLNRTVNSALSNIHLSIFSGGGRPFNLDANYRQTGAQSSLPHPNGELRWELFAKLDNTGPTNVALRVKPRAINPTAQLQGSSRPMVAGRFEAAHVSSAESHRTQHLPTLYQEDTPFSTEVRMPVADLWGGRLQFDGFCREISANSMVHGLPQSGGIWWATPQSLTPRPATSYGIQLSFRMPHIRPRTLYRYLLGRGG
jgi:hypothetical protein